MESTVLLTTQYLEEADRLASRSPSSTTGVSRAQGTASQLKATVGGSVLSVRLADAARVGEAVAAVASLAVGEPPRVDAAEREIRLAVSDPGASSEAISRFDARRLPLVSVELEQPSLDDVFLTLTGHPAAQPSDNHQPEDATL